MENASMMENPSLPWLGLLQKPYANMFGPKNMWDLRMADGTAVRIERGSQGLNNALYRIRINGDVYACKLFIVDERRRAQREWGALCTLGAAGLKLAPEPVAFAPDGPLPQPAIVYRWVNGETLAGNPLTIADLQALVAALGQVHRAPATPKCERLVAWHQPVNYAAYLAEIRAAAEQVRAWVAGPGAQRPDLPGWAADIPAAVPLIAEAVRLAEAVVAGASTPGDCPTPALVRVDGNLDNVLRTAGGSLVFLDWEYSGWGDPAYDLAELRWHPRGQHVSQAQWKAALATYVPLPNDPTFAERLAVYSRLLPLWWIGRSALHLLEGAKQVTGRQRLVSVPERMYRSVRGQLNSYLAAVGLIERPEVERSEEKENDD
jgi:aminoglycoside phosphotransferase (APT) family kinase protein